MLVGSVNETGVARSYSDDTKPYNKGLARYETLIELQQNYYKEGKMKEKGLQGCP